MDYKTIQPSLGLKPFVRHYWMLELQVEDLPYTQHLTPYGWMELFFTMNQDPIDVNPETMFDDGVFTGFFQKSVSVEYTKPTKAIGISFQPWATEAVFKMPAYQFTNKTTYLSDIDPSAAIRSHLNEAADELEIIKCIEHYLVCKLKDSQLDEVAVYLSKAISNSFGDGIAYESMIQKIGLSKRRIEQRFLSSIGVPMGYFARSSRFDRALYNMTHQTNASLTQIGLYAGYYDQSHFIREFKRLTDSTPKSYRKSIAQMNQAEVNFIML